MAADKSLKDLSNAVYKIAENSPKIQKDVKDIRDAVCGTDGILESLYVINKNMENSKKKDSLSKLSGKKSNGINNKLLKSTSSITSVLKNILNNVKGILNKDNTKNTEKVSSLLKDIHNDVKKVSRKGDKKIQVDEVGKNNKPTVSLLRRILNAIKNISGRNGERRQESRRLERYPEDRRDRKIKGLETVSRSVEIIERLKNIRFVDFVLGKKKMQRLSTIMMASLNLFRQFKNRKEAEGTISFVNSSIDIIKRLSKIWIISKPAQLGAKVIEKIFLGNKKGNGGLLELFRKIDKNKKQIETGKKTIGSILKSCGSFLLTTMILTGVAALSIPAMAGALLMKGVIYLLIGTYKILNKSSKVIIKGSVVLLAMSTSVITFALGLGLMVRSIKGMNLKDIGLMVASIAGVGLSVAGIGLLAIPIAIGSASLLLMGASIGILGLALKSWKQMDSKSAMANIKTTINDLKDAFGLNSKESTDGKGLGSKLKGVASDALGFASAIFQFGKTFFQVGSILLCVGVMAFTRKRLDEWKDYNPGNAISNIKNTLGGIKEALGLDTNEPENLDTKGLLKQAGGVISDALGFGAAILNMGKMFFQMGSIFLGVGMMNSIRDNLEKWNDYNSTPAIGNIKKTISNLKEAMGLISNNEENEENTTEQKAKWYERVWEGIKNTGKKISTVASGVANGIKSMAKLSGMVDFTSAMAEIKDYLSPYDNYDSSKSIGNIRNTVIDLLSVVKDGDDSIKRSNAFKKTSEHIKDGLKDLERGFKNIKTIQTVHEPIDKTVRSINMLDLEKATVMTDMFKSFAKIENRPLNKFTDAVNRFVKSCGELIGSMNRLSDSNESVDRTQEVVVDNSTNSSPKNNGSFYIENTKDLAQAIAEAIKSLPINVENNMSDIRLVVDGTSGKKVILSLE